MKISRSTWLIVIIIIIIFILINLFVNIFTENNQKPKDKDINIINGNIQTH
jgi:hypothetical protein